MNKISKLIASLAVFAFATIGFSGCSLFGNDEAGQTGSQDDKKVIVSLGGVMDSLNSDTSIGHTGYNVEVAYTYLGNIGYFDNNDQWKWNNQIATVTKTSDNPLTIQYKISDNAKWSDGVPVTGADLLLKWAGISANLNDELGDDQVDGETGAAKPNADQVYFDGGDGISDAMEEPVISEDGKTVTVEWKKFVPNWQYSLADFGVPAHVVAEKAFGLGSPDDSVSTASEATARLVAAIEDKEGKKDDLIKVANTWSSAFNLTSTPADKRLLVSAGAYTIDEIADKYVSLTKNPNFTAGPAPKVGKLQFEFISDPAEEEKALRNGDVDVIATNASEDIVSNLKATEGLNTQEFLNGKYKHIDLQQSDNVESSPFSAAHWGGDKDKAKAVRQAFLTALPQQDVVDKLAKSVYPEAVPMKAFNLLTDDENYQKTASANGSEKYGNADIDGAKKILADAGIDTSTPIDITFFYGQAPENDQVFKIIAEAEKNAGFNVSNDSVSSAEFSSKLVSGSYDVRMFAWSKSNPDVSDATANFTAGGQNNFVNYSNSKVDELYSQLNNTDDLDEQISLNIEIEKYLVDDAFGTPLYQNPAILAYKNNIKNVTPSTLGAGVMHNFWEWEVE